MAVVGVPWPDYYACFPIAMPCSHPEGVSGVGKGWKGLAVPRVEMKGDGELNICTGPVLHFPKLPVPGFCSFPGGRGQGARGLWVKCEVPLLCCCWVGSGCGLDRLRGSRREPPFSFPGMPCSWQ